MQHPETRDLPVELTDAELLVKSRELATHMQKLYDIRAEAKLSADGYKSTIKTLEQEIAEMQRVVKTGKELRPVEIFERKRFSRSVVEVVRADTFEVVRTRPMTDAEKQRGFFDEAPPFDSSKMDTNDEENAEPADQAVEAGAQAEPVSTCDEAPPMAAEASESDQVSADALTEEQVEEMLSGDIEKNRIEYADDDDQLNDTETEAEFAHVH